MDSAPKLTDTIAAAKAGDCRAAAELMPLLYAELRKLGKALMRQQPPGHTLQATALVHEAYAKVVGTTDPGWDGRAHFFGAATRAMREILVDQARRRQSYSEPDLAWIRAGSYRTSYPTPADVGLLIEVSLSSVRFDRREKAELYAEANIAEYWLVDISKQTIEVRRRPKGILYQDIQIAGCGERISPLCQPASVLEISELFPASQ